MHCSKLAPCVLSVLQCSKNCNDHSSKVSDRETLESRTTRFDRKMHSCRKLMNGLSGK